MSSSRTESFLLSERGDIIRCALAEFVGTAILVLFTCGTCVSTFSPYSPTEDLNPPRGDALVATALSFGLTVTCLAATLGHVSGCHVNPGVTLGLLTNGQLNVMRAAVYFVSQLLGGSFGAWILSLVLQSGSNNVCVTKLNGVSVVQGIVVEAFIVFLLVLVVCNVCESNPALVPVIIGLAVAAGHLFAIPLTSSSMNPARSFGPALVQGYWDDHYVYWIGPLVGGATAGLLHRFLFQNKTLYNNKSLRSTGEPVSLTNI